MAVNPLFDTQRNRLIAMYTDEKKPFRGTTKPYRSTVFVVWDVVNPLPVGGNPLIAHAVARKQDLIWFNYGVGDVISCGGGSFKATKAETNMLKGNETNGAEDFAIEGFACTNSGTFMLMDGADVPSDITDADVKAAYAGPAGMTGASPLPVRLYDPASLAMPPQGVSPFNLEAGLYGAIAPAISCQCEWSEDKIEQIGTLDEIPEAGGKSYLRSNGNPDPRALYKVPEGFIWRRKGQPDSMFQIKGKLEEPVVAVVSLVPLAGSSSETGLKAPKQLVTAITLRAHGLVLSTPSKN